MRDMASGARRSITRSWGILRSARLPMSRSARWCNGDFGFVDSARLRMKGTQKLVAEMTLRDGQSGLGPERNEQRGLGSCNTAK